MDIQTGTTFQHDGLEFTITAVVYGAYGQTESFVAIAFNGRYYVSRTFNLIQSKAA